MVLGDKVVAPKPGDYVAWRGWLDLSVTPGKIKDLILEDDIDSLNFHNSHIVL
jgi:hypothetical protein